MWSRTWACTWLATMERILILGDFDFKSAPTRCQVSDLSWSGVMWLIRKYSGDIIDLPDVRENWKGLADDRNEWTDVLCLSCMAGYVLFLCKGNWVICVRRLMNYLFIRNLLSPFQATSWSLVESLVAITFHVCYPSTEIKERIDLKEMETPAMRCDANVPQEWKVERKTCYVLGML